MEASSRRAGSSGGKGPGKGGGKGKAPVDPAAKPTVGAVLKYVERTLRVLRKTYGKHVQAEHWEEIEQNAKLRAFEAYDRLDTGRGWKAFLQRHCRGALSDYKRAGHGFKESAHWLTKTTPEKRDANPHDLRERLVPHSSSPEGDGGMCIEELAGLHGIFAKAEIESCLSPTWPLIARMASVDTDIHVVGKLFRGFTVGEIAEQFGVSSTRISQRISRFFHKLDSPQFYNTPWVNQTIYAFGLWDLFNMDPADNCLGWDLDPVDLDARDSAAHMRSRMTLVEV